MYRVVAPVLFATGALLHGCGGGETTAAPPSPTPPTPAPVPKPDIWVEVFDAAKLEGVISENATFEVVGTKEQFTFTEGPVWVSGSWIFSDIPASIQYQFKGGSVTEFRNPSNKSVGNALLSDGKLLTCEIEGRSVVMVDVSTKERTVIADLYNESNLTSPNDIVISKKGVVYFTDPSYGTDPGGGHGFPSDQSFNNVFRLDKSGSEYAKELVSVEQNLVMPNGIVFNPDETKLYISDTGAKENKIWVYDVNSDGTLKNKVLFAHVADGAPDGIRVDTGGRLWSSTGKGVNIYASDKTLIAKIHVPEFATNLAFGGSDGKDLMITAVSSVWIVKTNATAPELASDVIALV